METTTMLRQRSTFILSLCIVLLVEFFSAALPTGYGSEPSRESTSTTITLDAQNEPLRSVLGKISKTTRWKINAPDKWLDKPVTQELKKATLEEGLRSVLKSSGIENLLLIYDENTKIITLLDTEGLQGGNASRLTAQGVRTPPPVVSATVQRDSPEDEDTRNSRLRRPTQGTDPGPSRGGGRRGRRHSSSDD